METRAASPELRAGDEFAGHRIEGVLGRGGMGVVYRAVDLRLNRVVALKLMTATLSSDEDFRRRFQRESELAASVRQQNIVTIYQAGEADGLLFVTMELVHGTDLRGLITDRGRIDMPTASAIVTQVAAALDAAHASGLVHRDVKPANVLIAGSAPLHVYLTDFGLTKRTSSQTGITKTGLFVGTIDYAAPEQIKGWPVDARADVYALGCGLFEGLAGRRRRRRVRPRLVAFRDPRRAAAVPTRERVRDDVRARVGAGVASGRITRARRRGCARAGEGARGPLPVRRRPRSGGASRGRGSGGAGRAGAHG